MSDSRQKALDRLKAARERLAAKGKTSTDAANVSTAQPSRPPHDVNSGGNSSASRSAPSVQPVQAGGTVETQSTEASNSGSSKQHRDAADAASLPPVPKKFKNYVDYDLAKLKDSKGGYMVDDVPEEVAKEESLEKLEEQKKIMNQRPAFLDDPDLPKCFECKTTDIDYKMYNIFKARVCQDCRKKYPDKYTLLTKTECREDYLLTDPELRDAELLPHLERPNPHKQSFNNMMLYMRYQVEEYAFKKWGSAEELDAEYERREQQKKERRDKSFLKKIQEMRKKTRAQAYTQVYSGNHEHAWGDAVEKDGQQGVVERKCLTCGTKREEIVMGSIS